MDIKPIAFFPVLFVILVALQASGCRDGFQPLTNNNRYALSMGGYLALHVDTQWVRVMPIGNTLIPRTGESNNLIVSITREKTSTTSTMRDSLFMFGGSALVWNYWAKLSLHPNEEYRFHAEWPDGRSSETTVTMPSRLPLPVVNNFDSTRGIVRGSFKDPIVMADIKYYVRKIRIDGSLSRLLEARVSHLDHVYTEDEEYSFKFNDIDAIGKDIGYARFGFVVERAELLVATASKDWPDYIGLSDREKALPGLVSNINNGTGFIAGIALRKVPLKNCYDDDGNLIACEQLY